MAGLMVKGVASSRALEAAMVDDVSRVEVVVAY